MSKKHSQKKIKKQKKQKKETNLLKNFFSVGTVAIGIIAIVFLVDSYFLWQGQIRRNVFVEDKNIGGYDRKRFSDFVESYRKDVFSKKVFLNIGGTEIIVLPKHLGLDLDSDSLWEKVYLVGREKGVWQRFVSWLNFSKGTQNVPLDTFIDIEQFSQFVKTWEKDAQLKQPFEGSVEIKGLEVITRYPESGKGIDISALQKDLTRVFLKKNTKTNLVAPIIDTPYRRDPKTLQDLAQKVHYFIDQPVRLANTKFDDVELELSVNDLIDIINISVSSDPEIQSKIAINDLAFAQKLLVLKVKDAEFKIDEDYNVEIEPGQTGVDVNLEETKKNFLNQIFKPEPEVIHIAIDDLYLPEFSEKDADRLGVKHVVSEFTTHYTCCQNRADNIHLMADLLDGTVVNSGEVLNLNKFIGERTVEKGFKPAGSIIKGKMTDTVGGGISQFVTTFHNAIYWGGYQILVHKPHSIYFSRYPHGIEATINWPDVDYIFKNDTDGPIVIDTEYTDTTITVRVLGNNDGRVIVGDHKKWSTPMRLVKKGGKNARRVESFVAKASGFLPPLVSYISDSSIPRGKKILSKTGRDGWRTLVERKVLLGKDVYRYNAWPVLYSSGKDTFYKVHPCDNPEEEKKPKNC